MNYIFSELNSKAPSWIITSRASNTNLEVSHKADLKRFDTQPYTAQ